MSKLVAFAFGLSCISSLGMAATAPEPYVPDSPSPVVIHHPVNQTHKKSSSSVKSGQIESLTAERMAAMKTFTKPAAKTAAVKRPAEKEPVAAPVTAKTVPHKTRANRNAAVVYDKRETEVAATKKHLSKTKVALAKAAQEKTSKEKVTKERVTRTRSVQEVATAKPRTNARHLVKAPRQDALAYRAAPRKEPIAPVEPIRAPMETHANVALQSHSALVMNAETGHMIYGKNAAFRTPIASITKLMTAMVTLDAHLPMDATIRIADADVDRLKMSSSRLEVGTVLSRYDTMWLALMSSENRAAAALARTYPGGKAAFVAAMNRKARSLGMVHTIFLDPTGLNKHNTSTAADLALMVQAAYRYPQIRQFTTSTEHDIISASGRQLHYQNSNALVREGLWSIELSKTGYIKEAGHCLVMVADVQNRPMIMVFLDSAGTMSRIEDAKNLKSWLETRPLDKLS